MNNKKIRLLGYYNFPNQKMNPENERVEDAQYLAPLLESSINSLYLNPDTDEDLKAAIEAPTVFIFKDEEGKLYAFFSKDKLARVTGVVYNRRDIKQVPLKYKAWFYPGQNINLIQQKDNEMSQPSTETKRRNVPVRKERNTTTTSQTSRYVENDEVAKVKIRLRLENNFFIGQFSPELKDGRYKISDIRNTDFTKIEDKERGIKDLTIFFNSQGKDFNRFAYYKFTWVLLSSSPIRFGIDINKEITPVYPEDIVKCLHDSIVHYPASAAKKITRTLDTLNKQLTQSGKEVFIYELLQNANDYPRKIKDKSKIKAISVDVEFYIRDNYLIFQHTGDYFNAKNIAAICDINDGEKSDNVEAIGYKGIGFKTVFLDNDYVYLRTGNYSFRFDKYATDIINTPWQILPVWTDYNELDPIINSVFRLYPNDQYRVKFALRPRDKKILTDRNRNDNYIDLFKSVFDSERVILFIPNIQKVSIFLGGASKPIIRERNSKDWCVSEALTDIIPDRVWQRINDVLTNPDADKSGGYDKIPEKYFNFHKTEVKFACKKEGRKLLPVDNAILYCYLPAKRADWGFDFLMNTDMVPNGARDDIDDIDLNHEISRIAGRQFFYWIKALISSKEFELDSIFSLIPNWDECKKHRLYKLFIEEFQEEFEKLLKEIPFVPVINADGNESFETIDHIIDDRTGLTENNVMTDDDFINLMGMDGGCLPIQELRESEHFMNFLYHYCPGEMDVDFDDVKKKCDEEEFQTWLKDIDNNTEFLTHLLKKNELNNFSSKTIFIEYENDLFKASDLYYDFDSEGYSISYLKKFVPHLCEHTRVYFKNNEDWELFADNNFMEFDAQSIVNDYIVDNEDAIELLKSIDNSVNFYKFVAEKEVDLSQAKNKLSFVNEDGNAITFSNDCYLYFYSDNAYQISKQTWIGDNDIQILSHLYLTKDVNDTLKAVFEDLGFSTFDMKSLLELLKDDDDFKQEVNRVIGDSFETNISFVRFFFNNKEELKYESGLFKNYLLCCQDIDNLEDYLCNDDLRYFNQSSYNDNSTFVENTQHEWLDKSWMYCLSKKYFDAFEPVNAKALETFLRQQFGIETFTDKSFFENVVLKNKKDIYATLTSKEKMLPFLEYLHRDMKHIFDGSLNYNQIKDMPLLCSDDIIRVHDDSNVKFYRYDEEATSLFAKDWCPSTFAVLSEIYSEYFDDSFFKLFYIDKYDINEVLKGIVPSMRDELKNDNEKNIDFWRWVKNNQKNINDFEQLKTLSLLDSDRCSIDSSSLYISDVYQSDGIENLVKKYDENATFVSSFYLEDNIDKEKNDWLKLFKKLGLKSDNKDILFNSVIPNLSEIEDDAVLSMMTKHLKDLKNAWEEIKSQLLLLKVRTRSGSYLTLDKAIIINIDEENIVEPFKSIVLLKEIDPEVMSSNNDIIQLIASEFDDNCIYTSKQEWAQAKLKEYIDTIQIDESKREATHVDFIRELASLISNDFVFSDNLLKQLLFKTKNDSDGYLLATDLTLGAEYKPACEFESNGITSLCYLSEVYLTENNKDTVRSFFKKLNIHHSFEIKDIELLSDRAFALYFWGKYYTRRVAEFEEWIENGEFNEKPCIPTEGAVISPEELYSPEIFHYARNTLDWQRKVPAKSVVDSIKEDEARRVFYNLPFKKELSFEDCLHYLLLAKDNRYGEDYKYRKTIIDWIISSEDRDDSLISWYREQPNATWRNGKGQFVHIKDLYVIHPDAKQERNIFIGDEHVMGTSMFPSDFERFEETCDTLQIKCLRSSDFRTVPNNPRDETVEILKFIMPKILVLSAIEKPEKYQSLFEKYVKELKQYRFLVCDYIDLGYESIHNDIERIYSDDKHIYYVESWIHPRTYTKFCSKLKGLLGIDVYTNVFEDVLFKDVSIETCIEKYCSYLMYDEAFRKYLQDLNQDISKFEYEYVPEDEEEDKYYSDTIQEDKDEEPKEDINQDKTLRHEIDSPISKEEKDTKEDVLNSGLDKINTAQKQEDNENDKKEDSNSPQSSEISQESIVKDEVEISSADEEIEDDEDSVDEESIHKQPYNIRSEQSDYPKSQSGEKDQYTDSEFEQKKNKAENGKSEDTEMKMNPHIHDEYIPVDEEGEPYDPDSGNIMGDVSDDSNYEPVGTRTHRPFRRKIAKQYTKEEINRLRSNGTPLELESLPATDEEINILAQYGISVEQIADTNYLVQLRLYNNLIADGEIPEESQEEFVKNADDVAIHKLRDGRYIHSCSAARGVMYISPSVWNKMVDDKWKICVYLDGRGKNFHYINSAQEFLKLVEKDDVVIKITGSEKVEVVRQLYSGILENVKGTAYTLIRVAARTNMDAVFAHYVGAMAEPDDGNEY